MKTVWLEVPLKNVKISKAIIMKTCDVARFFQINKIIFVDQSAGRADTKVKVLCRRK